MKKYLYNISGLAVVVISTIIFAVITIMSLFFTTYFLEDRVESIIICKDSIALNIFFLLVVWILFSILFFRINIERIKLQSLERIVILLVIVISIFWIILVQANPFADGKEICEAMVSFSDGDYSALSKDAYFGKFPFQLGLLFIFEKILWLAGSDNYIFLQVLNVFALAIAFHLLFKTFLILFDNKRASIILLILFVMCFPAMLYCTFIYGTMYGFALSTGAIYYIVKYLEENKKRYMFYAIPLLLISVILKNNYLIVFVALSGLLVVECLKNDRIYILLFIPVFLGCNILLTTGIQDYYKDRSGKEIHSGIPSISWVAMGLQDGNKGPGWYNQTMFNIYERNKQDTEKTSEESKEIIKKTLTSYKGKPQEFCKFILRKIVSQWNEPTYESLWVSEHPKNDDMHRIQLSRVANSIYYGKLNVLYWGYCNIYHLLVFSAAFIGFFAYRKKMNVRQCIFAIIIIGGFLFHIIWEANSKYILTYFIYVLPYAALGIDKSIKETHKLIKIKKKFKAGGNK